MFLSDRAKVVLSGFCLAVSGVLSVTNGAVAAASALLVGHLALVAAVLSDHRNRNKSGRRRFAEQVLADIETPDARSSQPPDIPWNGLLFVGVGGAGGNVVRRLEGVTRAFCYRAIALNSDQSDLATLPPNVARLVGRGVTHGLGCGGDPATGARAAESDRALIESMFSGARAIVLAVGLGGGFGTGAAPLIARWARARGIRVSAVAFLPLAVEGNIRHMVAVTGQVELSLEVDSLVVVDLEEAVRSCDPKMPISDALARIDREHIAPVLSAVAA